MATKKANSTKAKTKTKAKPAVTKVEKTAVQPKVEKASAKPSKAKAPIQPKIMTSLGNVKEAKKSKGPDLPISLDGVDPEWLQLNSQNKATPVEYAMANSYQPKSVIKHKILGIGFVVSATNNRIEVVFKEGKKTLITNYKK